MKAAGISQARLLVSSGLVIVCGVVRADAIPPPFSIPEAAPDPAVAGPPVTGVHLGKLTLPFEQVPLSKVRAIAGVGEIAKRGDAAETTYWLCYTIEGPTAQRVWLIAGEPDGPDHFVSGIQALALAPGSAGSESCPTLPSRLQPLSLVSGLWLGVPRAALPTALGTPSVSSYHASIYSYITKVPGPYQDGHGEYDRTSLVQLMFQDGKVQGIVASQRTTY